LAHFLEFCPLSKKPKAQLIQGFKVISVFIDVRRKQYEKSLSPTKHQHSDKKGKNQNTRGHSIKSIYVDTYWSKEFEVAEQLKDAERVEERG
jgi:hypothetical protein